MILEEPLEEPPRITKVQIEKVAKTIPTVTSEGKDAKKGGRPKAY